MRASRAPTLLLLWLLLTGIRQRSMPWVNGRRQRQLQAPCVNVHILCRLHGELSHFNTRYTI